MKTFLLYLLVPFLLFAQEPPHVPSDGTGIFVFPAGKKAAPTPMFFSVAIDSVAKFDGDRVIGESQLNLTVHQGVDEAMSLELLGEGDVVSVTGDGLKDWAVRRGENARRFLDLRVNATEAGRKQWSLTMRNEVKRVLGENDVRLLLPGKGSAVGYSLRFRMQDEAKSGARIIKAQGFSPIEKTSGHEFLATSDAELRLAWGDGLANLSLVDAKLTGFLAADGRSVQFSLEGVLRSKSADSEVELFGGGATLSDSSEGDGWRVELRKVGDHFRHVLVASREGDIPLSLRFDVAVMQTGGWRMMDFSFPAGVVLPVWFRAWPAKSSFADMHAVVPKRDGEGWRGFLPADGKVKLAWKDHSQVADGALFFSSSEMADIRIGSGLMRTSSVIELRVLQGQLTDLLMDVAGRGEILAVTGSDLTGWDVSETDGKRRLRLRGNRPIHGVAKFTIESQVPLDAIPFRGGIMKLTPVGALRHSGWLRVANEGAVKIQVAEEKGLIQLAPSQYPIAAQGLRQAYVYRFPSAEYDCQVSADHILPEVAVNDVVIHEFTETERKIEADIELDIREAPLREWELGVPSDYSVVQLQGAAVADYNISDKVENGLRRVKVLFTQAVQDRQLIQLKLEKNEVADGGEWTLPQLEYVNVTSHRGFIGVVSVPGFRMTLGKGEGLVDVPLAYFPKPQTGLQQSWRLRDGKWSAVVAVEELGQSIQADVFHLYTIKEGAVYGSVLLNYFIVGSPATEWRVRVPEALGNIDISGQGVGHEWRREGDQLIVPLASPMLGAATMLIRFEQPVAATGANIRPGEIRPLEVQSERGYIQMVSPLQVKHEITEETGALLPLQAAELPAEYGMLSSLPTLRAWQYITRDFSLGMQFSWFPAGEMVEQVVDFVNLSTQLSRDGQWVTEAKYYVKSKRREALRLSMPEGSELLETSVAGAVITPRVDGKEIIIPLPQEASGKEPLLIALRYGRGQQKGTRIRIAAPIIQAPVVMGEWNLQGDSSRVLTPVGGTAELTGWRNRPRGLDWLSEHLTVTWLTILLLISVLVWFRMARHAWIGLLVLAAMFAMQAVVIDDSPPQDQTVLHYSAPVVQQGGKLFVEVDHESGMASRIDVSFWGSMIAAVLCVVVAWKYRLRFFHAIALAVLCYGFLSMRGGIALSFSVLAIGCFVAIYFAAKYGRKRIKPLMTSATACLLFFGMPDVRAEGVSTHLIRGMEIEATISEGRLSGTIKVSVQGVKGSRYDLIHAPAVIASVKGDGLRIVRDERGQAIIYQLLAEADGALTADVAFEMAVSDPRQPWVLPVGDSIVRKMTLLWDQADWQWTCPQAVWLREQASEKKATAAAFLFRAAGHPQIIPTVKKIDAASVPAVFFVESAQYFMPLPGVINGRHRFHVRPSQGRVDTLSLQVPKGFIVSDVQQGPIGFWRFDPQTSTLTVALEPAQEAAFSFVVETQRGSTSLPLEWMAEPMRINGAAGEVGLLALTVGDDTQAQNGRSEGMSQVNPDDFPADLLPKDADEKTHHTPAAVYRYGTAAATLNVRVTEVAAELRVESHQVLSLGADRVLLAVDLNINITRSGVFRFVAEIPDGMEVETVSGDSLSDWSEKQDGKTRLLVMDLTGRTMGKQAFHLSFTGAATGANAKWRVPHLVLREATKETGTLIAVPARGLRIGVEKKENLSATDLREMEQSGKITAAQRKPGALAFRLLQKSWNLELNITELQPWITAQVYHESIIREGQVGSDVTMIYQIENAAVKSLRVRIPGLTDATSSTVRAEGADVADFVKVKDAEDLWEIRFKNTVTGRTELVVEFQQQLGEEDFTMINPLRLEDARQASYVVGLCPGGRLELSLPTPLPDGWNRSELSMVNAMLPRRSNRPQAVHFFKVSELTAALKVGFQRHQLARFSSMRVTGGVLTTLVSSHGEALTAVNLQLKVTEKDTMHLKLPPSAALYNVLVNDEAALLVRDGADWLFHVFPSPDQQKPATVRFVYATSPSKSLRLESPRCNVPMENINWRVIVPTGWDLTGHGGDFDWKKSTTGGVYSVTNYQQQQAERKQASSREAVSMLGQAQTWMTAGDQAKAAMCLSNASRNGMLDEASNEDARVQYSALKTQQAVLGLNTRRQKNYLDNGGGGYGNKQLEQAAQINPLLQGQYNYDPKNFERFIDGNTEEENAALKDIAGRIVTQQIAAEPAPSALDITLPDHGTIYEFQRRIQVDGHQAAYLELRLRWQDRAFPWIGIVLCAVVGLVGFLFVSAGKKESIQ